MGSADYKSIIMRFILMLTFNFEIMRAVGFDTGLRMSLEEFKLLYVNEKHFQGHTELIPVNNKTNKLRGTGLILYEPGDNLEISVTAYKIMKKNKEYLFTRVKKQIKVFMFCALFPSVEELLEHFAPRLTWPAKPNITYTLRDWWLQNSQVPNEFPVSIPTGRFKGIGTILYPNNTILATAQATVNIIHSHERYE